MEQTQQREEIQVMFKVDKGDFEEARRIMGRLLTKNEDPNVVLPLTDEQVAFSIYLYGWDAYMESYGEDEEDDNRAEALGVLAETVSNV